MSFTFDWPRFSDQFHYDAIHMLNNALNKGNKPPVIADKIEVVELEMGTEAPELEIREIGDLTMDQFRGIFRFSYSGDAHLVLKTKVQANPLNHKQPDIHLMAGSKGMLAAKQPLVVPMLLRLSHFKLRSIVVLVVSKQKGITLVFKTDPLQNVDINSTFDSIAVIQKFIQREIEGQLRQMFREDLPGIIHRLSQQWVKAKVEAPYLNKRPPPPPSLQSDPVLSFQNVANIPTVDIMPMIQKQHLQNQQMSAGSIGMRRARTATDSVFSAGRRTSATAPQPTSPPAHESPSSTFPDLEHFDPTYGLRPEGLPTKSVFKGFSSLFTASKGLVDLTEESEPSDGIDFDDASTSFDVVDWENAPPLFSPSPSDILDRDTVATEYETIPAVGGGIITRPRILHSQSMAPEIISARPRLSRSSSHILSGLVTPGLHTRPPNTAYNPYFPDMHDSDGPAPQTAPPFFQTYARPITPDSLETQPSYSSGDITRQDPNQSIDDVAPFPSARRLSVSSSPSNLDMFPSNMESDPRIVLSSVNPTLHQLSTLSHSNHTLSPYTRSVEHFTVRSGPPRASNIFAQGHDRQPVKAKRRRTHHLGGQRKQPPADIVPPTQLPSPRSPVSDLEFDASDMDRYFRSHEDPKQQSYPHVQLRKSYLHTA